MVKKELELQSTCSSALLTEGTAEHFWGDRENWRPEEGLGVMGRSTPGCGAEGHQGYSVHSAGDSLGYSQSGRG